MKHTIVTIMEAIGRGIRAVAHAVAGVVMGKMVEHIVYCLGLTSGYVRTIQHVTVVTMN